MKKVICCTEEHLPKRFDSEALYLSMFSSTGGDKLSLIHI